MSRFSEHIPLNQIRDGQRIEMGADEDERRTIAGRLGLESLERLEAHAALSRDGESVRAEGRVKAALTQSCVATGEPVAAHVDAPVDLLFVPEPADGRDDEIELDEEDCDTVFHDGSAIEIGDAIADTLALSLDPYPRSVGAEAALKEAGVLSEAEAGPFAALAKLKKAGDGG